MSRISKTEWGKVDGDQVYLFTINNTKGTTVKITNYGGIVVAWNLRDKKGIKSNIVVGLENVEQYLAEPPYFGAFIGRYGNRIANAQFQLNGKTYHLAANNGPNSLHGGIKAFDKRVLQVKPFDENIGSISFGLLSEDGDEGFPGNLAVTVKYTLSDEDALVIQYEATADQSTPINLSNHSYFNLSGNFNQPILNHTLTINATAYTPVDANMIPTGEFKPVEGTAFDFTSVHAIGERIEATDGGYDHNYVLNRVREMNQPVAVLKDANSGRSLEVYTTAPGLQLYTGNFLDGTFISSDGIPIQKHAAVCLETQFFPDSPNQPHFPSSILHPGELYQSTTIYKIVTD